MEYGSSCGCAGVSGMRLAGRRILVALLTAALVFGGVSLVPRPALAKCADEPAISSTNVSAATCMGESAAVSSNASASACIGEPAKSSPCDDSPAAAAPSSALATCSSVPTTSVKGTAYYSQAFKVLKLVNAQREAAGLSSLTMDTSLLNTAMLRAAETYVLFSHERPNGEMCFTANDLMYGENIAYGYTSASDVMNGWMNSVGHRANIMGSSYKTIGVGCVKVGSYYYWVQCFGCDSVSTAKSSAYKDGAKTYSVEVKGYTVSFNGNGGKAAKASKTVGYPGTYGSLPSAARAEYAFAGWYTAKSGGSRVKSSTAFTAAKNQTLYAHWKKTTVAKGAIASAKAYSGKKAKVVAKSVSGASGYQVVYAKNKSFTKGKAYKFASGKSVTLKDLKKGQKYYVKVRAYKTDSAGKKVYGSWSSAKSFVAR